MANIPVARRRGARAIALQTSGGRPGIAADTAAWWLASSAMVLALLTPAIWNGFPLIFPDTGGYFTAPILGTLANGRSALYGLFLDAGIPLAFWPNVIVQSIIMVWLFVVTLRVNGMSDRPWLAFGTVVMLTVCTSLPWFAGQLMPDILFPAAALAIYLLAYARDRLAHWECFALAGVIAFAMASHMAAAGMSVGIVAALWGLGHFPRLALPKPRLTFAAGAVAAGLVLCPVSNLAMTGSFIFTPGGTGFLFGRLIEYGIVARYLDDRCPDPSLRLCAYRFDLPDKADDWLWANSAFYELGGWEGYREEARHIIGDSIARYPGMHLTTAVAATLAQFRSFGTEISIHDNKPTFDSFREHIPHLLPSLMSARQQTGGLDVTPLNLLHVPAGALAIAGIGLALVLRRRLGLPPQAAALCLTILIALAANAAICGIFSHPVDRYQSRLIPLAPFAVAILVANHRRRPPPG